MDKTVAHLKKYLKAYHPIYDQNAPLFYARTHGMIHALSEDTVETMIKKYSKDCKTNGISMPDKPHCHMIRKTRAMDLYKSGMPLSHIQQLLGHESMSTTTGFYAFVTLDTLAKSMEKANQEDDGGRRWSDPSVLRQLYSL